MDAARLIRLLLLLVALLLAPLAAAQDSPLAPLDTSSPRATYQSFLDQARALDTTYAAYRQRHTAAGQTALAQAIGRGAGLFDLADTPPAGRAQVGAASFAYLKDILMRLPPIPAEAVADSGDRPLIPGTEIEIRRVTTGPREGQFLFSTDTVDRLPDFHARILDQPVLQPTPYTSWRAEQVRATGPLVPAIVDRAMPEALQVPILGTPLWKALVSVIAILAVARITEAWWRVESRRARGATLLRAGLWRLTLPLVLGGLTLLASTLIQEQIRLSGQFAFGFVVLFKIALYFAAAWAFRGFCGLIAEWMITSPVIAEYSYDAHLMRLIARIAALFGAALILVIGAEQIGVPLFGLLAGIGVGGFALALAAQSTVENLFGGVSLFADRPFRVGDFIIFPGGSGTVESIGPRSTQIRALDGMQITVPNADLAKMQVTNKTCRDATLFTHVVGLRHDSRADQLAAFAADLTARFKADPRIGQGELPPRVRLIALGASSIDVEVRVDVLTSDEEEYYAIQEELLLLILERLDRTGLALAFPSQTTYLAREAGRERLPLTPAG